jgi:hypothetical protein
MLKAGWHAHKLNSPGKFLVSSPEHDNPRRARAYLLTDDDVTAAAARYAAMRPRLDDISRLAPVTRPAATGTDDDTDDAGPGQPADPAEDPEAVLLDALSAAPDEGISVPELVAITGMSLPPRQTRRSRASRPNHTRTLAHRSPGRQP